MIRNFRTACKVSVFSERSSRLWLACLITATGIFVVPFDAVKADHVSRPADFGRQWVRSHPFTVMALNQGTDALDMNQYQAAGMNTLMAWWSQTAQQVNIANQADVSWHAIIDRVEEGLTSSLIAKINAIAAVPGGTGWLVHDEPDPAVYPQVGGVIEYLKHNFPDRLVYTNIGDASDIPWPSFFGNIQPDILMYDKYPFLKNGQVDMFQDLMAFRNKAQEENIPYFSFISIV